MNPYDHDYPGRRTRFKVQIPYHYFYLAQICEPDGKPTTLFKIGMAECCECRMKDISSYAFLYNKGYAKLIHKWKVGTRQEARQIELIAIYLIRSSGLSSEIGPEWALSKLGKMKYLARDSVNKHSNGFRYSKGMIHDAVV